MSYLNPLRLHFAGKFQANVSTVNNDPGHFDNASFKKSYQSMQGPNFIPPNGWFNPQGDATWRFLGCAVTAAWTPEGAVTSDPVLQCIVADSDTQAPAKLVDLDSEQQLVSEIWGLQVRIADSDGNTLMSGDFVPAAFLDIWDRALETSGGDVDAGAMYQSVLTNLRWADVSGSNFLTALKNAATDGMLSIKFNVDGINLTFTSPDFMCGRIVGTIGPATPSEPLHLVLGRQFMTASSSPPGSFFSPAGGINFFPAVVDADAGCIFLDLGNAISTNATSPSGMTNLGDLSLTVAGSSTPLGTIPSTGNGSYATDPTWYPRTAGIVAMPLTAAQISAIAAAPLTLASSSTTTISEWPNGAFVRADTYVYRMSPGDSVQTDVYATQWGQPLAGTSVTLTADPSQLQPSNLLHPHDVPPVATPADAISFPSTITTDSGGKASFALTGSDPGSPRNFSDGYGIDGQVYGVRPGFTDPSLTTGPINQWNFISILLWSAFTASNPVAWTDVEPIFVQYGNLYPVMSRFMDLGDYTSVVNHASLLSLAFGLDPSNPNAMPVTRDLSPAKRQAILSFLANPQPGAVAKPLAAAAPKAEEEPSPDAPKLARMGGKAAAAARRVIVQKGAAS